MLTGSAFVFQKYAECKTMKICQKKPGCFKVIESY